MTIAAAALLAPACQPADDTAAVNEAAGNEVSRLPSLPVAEPALDRAALLQAVAKAASVTSLGQDYRQAQRDLDGNRFEVRIRFGCDADDPRARFDPATRRLQLRVSPDLTADDRAIAAIGGDAIEAVEGFWIERPWLLSAGCPTVPAPEIATGPVADPVPANVEEPPTAPWRVGIAHFFTPAESRTARRGTRPYEVTSTLAESDAASAKGYDLVLTGRLRELPNGRVIACRPVGPAAPPECVVSVSFDQVRIERADTGGTVAEWRG